MNKPLIINKAHLTQNQLQKMLIKAANGAILQDLRLTDSTIYQVTAKSIIERWCVYTPYWWEFWRKPKYIECLFGVPVTGAIITGCTFTSKGRKEIDDKDIKA